jgi:biopolymer transport protein ExbB/TolQ
MELAIDLAVHAAERTASVVRREMSRGLSGLATVAASAAFLGLLLTVRGIVASFTACGCEKSVMMANIMRSLGEALVPTVYGVGVAVAASFAYQLLQAQVEVFDVEMRAAVLELPGQLRECMARRKR